MCHGEEIDICQSIKQGKVDLVISLLEGEHSLNERCGFLKDSLLSFAISNRQLEIALYLIRAGIDPNLENKGQTTAIHIAAACGDTEIVELLLQRGAKINQVSEFMATPLHMAAFHGHFEIAASLIKHKAPINIQGRYGQTSLHYAASMGHTTIVKLLLDNNASVNIINDSGSPLHRSAKSGHVDIVRLLLEHGADANLTNSRGKTPMDLARERNRIEALNLLIEYQSRKSSKENAT